MAITWRAKRDQLDADFSDAVDDLLSSSPYAWFVISGRRTSVEQAALYATHLAGGPVAARPGASAHEYGFAVDLALDAAPGDAGLQPDWNIKSAGWQWLFRVLSDHPILQCGLYFPKPDPGHVQMRHWRSLVNLKV